MHSGDWDWKQHTGAGARDFLDLQRFDTMEIDYDLAFQVV
jgi:hypothetical protein